jgi:hypothetical protein
VQAGNIPAIIEKLGDWTEGGINGVTIFLGTRELKYQQKNEDEYIPSFAL